MYNINISVCYDNNTSYRECLRKVCYMDISNLNIPFDQMEDLYFENLELITRYGSDEKNISLDKLGLQNWQNRKAIIKNKIQKQI